MAIKKGNRFSYIYIYIYINWAIKNLGKEIVGGHCFITYENTYLVWEITTTFNIIKL
jgi:hypothetical protein